MKQNKILFLMNRAKFKYHSYFLVVYNNGEYMKAYQELLDF